MELRLLFNEPTEKNLKSLEVYKLYLIHYEKDGARRLDIADYNPRSGEFNLHDSLRSIKAADVLGFMCLSDWRMLGTG